jgi:multidrug efflux system membrane fusion protein
MTLSRFALVISWVVAAGLLAGCSRKPPEPAKSAPPVVTVTSPVARLITDYEDFTGRTEPIRIVELRARVTGHLDHVHFRDGQDVTEGKPLFSIDSRIYKAEKDRALAALTKAQRHFATAEKNFKREDDLRKAGSGSKEAFDKAAGDLSEAEADIGAATAALELAEAHLAFTRISAPFDGRLSRRLVDPGNLVRADETPLTTIVDLDRLYATFDVDERTVMRFRELIRKGEIRSSREEPRTVQIGLADDDDGEFPLTGFISFTDNAIDAGTGTLRVRAIIRNPRLERAPWFLLSPGQFIRVRLPIGNPRPALLVPEKSLGTDQGQKYVFVVNEKDEAERRGVRLGPQFGSFRVIEGNALKSTDRVIVEGLLRVRPGTKVNPKPAEPMSPPATSTASPEPAPAPRESGVESQ